MNVGRRPALTVPPCWSPLRTLSQGWEGLKVGVAPESALKPQSPLGWYLEEGPSEGGMRAPTRGRETRAHSLALSPPLEDTGLQAGRNCSLDPDGRHLDLGLVAGGPVRSVCVVKAAQPATFCCSLSLLQRTETDGYMRGQKPGAQHRAWPRTASST